MADPTKRPHNKKSPYTVDRGMPGAFEGETVTRRGLMTGGALAAGGIASAAFALPALGFALGPMFNDDEINDKYQDVGSVDDFNPDTYVAKVITLVATVGEAGKTTIYVRKATPEDKSPSDKDGKTPMPYIAISTRCAHLGCPVRYFQASQKFICPCHGGVYGKDGSVDGGPPVRPLDRFYTKEQNGRVLVGKRFSLNSKLERFSPRDPSNHLDGLWQYLYPSRPST
ncbi:MAG: menaquinol-cytochrome c reductase iron-sulfur subunit [Solirubrobacteraceae bacterium]|nr:menaquinol-cytochrome c reductase iron-sulfur subunit [Solirubrobacteraceae bacterium]